IGIVCGLVLIYLGNPYFFHTKIKLMQSTGDHNTYYFSNTEGTLYEKVYGDSEVVRFCGSIEEYAKENNYKFLTKEEYQEGITPKINPNCPENQLCEGETMVMTWTCSGCLSNQK
ncbi:MAG: hypothetical protein KKB31_04975, partial [Nanoarchaeota archaeon]|nr:hypothetical protein [Nanoarchaeota archaeon]